MTAMVARYPHVRLIDFKPFAAEPPMRFLFSDMQAATGFDLAEGRKAMNMLRASGLVERIEQDVPAYRLTAAALELLRDRPWPEVLPPADSLMLASLLVSHNARGLPLKIDAISVTTAVTSAAVRTQDAEVHLVVQTKRAVGDEIQAVAKQVETVVGGRVSVLLEWRLGAS